MPDAELLVRELLRSKKVNERQIGARVYGTLGKGIREDALLAVCRDPDLVVVENARYGVMSYVRATKTPADCLAALTSDATDPILKAAALTVAVEALARMTAGAERDAMTATLRTAAFAVAAQVDGQNACAGLQALGNLPLAALSAEDGKAILTRLRAEKRLKVKVAACSPFLRGIPDGDELLGEWCAAPEAELRLAAAAELSNIHAPACAVLIDCACGSEGRIRLKAAQVLTDDRFADTVEREALFASMLNDPVWTVRVEAVKALGAVSGRTVSKELLAKQDDERPEVRAVTLSVLAAKGVLGKERLLQAMVTDTVPASRLAALEVLTPAQMKLWSKDVLALIADADLDVACTALERAPQTQPGNLRAIYESAARDPRLAVSLTGRVLLGGLPRPVAK